MSPHAQGPSIPEEFRDGARILVNQRSSAINGIVKGRAYNCAWVHESLASGSKTYAQFTVPSGYYMALDFREVTTDKERIFYRVYASYPTVTESTTVPARNMRSDGPAVVAEPMYKCSAPSPAVDPNNAIVRVPVFGEPAGGGKASGDVSTDNIFRLLAPSSKFLLELENASTQAAYIEVVLVFRFIPENEIEVSS